MPKYLAVVLAGAVVVMMAGFYLMAPSLTPYDMASAERALASKEAEATAPKQKKGILSALMATVQTELETARKQYLGEHLPKTPDGWKIEKTHHDEIVAFTLDYQLDLTLNDKSSMRRLSGWGSTTGARPADVKYTNGDKVIFLRLVGRQRTSDTPLRTATARLFIGREGSKETMQLADLSWERYVYPGTDLINIATPVGYDTAIGIFTNASVEDVETLLSGMDIAAFAGLRGLDKDGKPPIEMATVPVETLGGSTDNASMRSRADTGENMIAGLGDSAAEDEEPEPQGAQRSKPKNLLGALLSGGSEKAKKTKINRDRSGSGESFKRKAGTFGSNCAKANGAKFCAAGD